MRDFLQHAVRQQQTRTLQPWRTLETSQDLQHVSFWDAMLSRGAELDRFGLRIQRFATGMSSVDPTLKPLTSCFAHVGAAVARTKPACCLPASSSLHISWSVDALSFIFHPFLGTLIP